MDSYGLIHMDSYGLIHMDSYGFIWIYMILYGSMMIYVYGFLCIYMVGKLHFLKAPTGSRSALRSPMIVFHRAAPGFRRLLQ